MKKWSKHEKVTLGLAIIAILLLAISCCPGGYEEATGILQGLATGVISGMMLLLINGIKSKEYRRLTQSYHAIHESNLSLEKVGYSYGSIYHETYHGKKERMDFNVYLSLIEKTFEEYREAYETLRKIDFELIPDDSIRTKLKEYFQYMEQEIYKVNSMIGNVESGDKEALTKIKECFYCIQQRAYQLSSESRKLENEIYMKREHIDNSLF